MELIGQIPVVGGLLEVALPFLIVLAVVVFVHEFGHYIVGRWCGIHAQVFSVGFGRPLFGWTDRRGTRWQVGWLPLGGYVKFVGDMDPASAGRVADESLTLEERRAAFHNATLPRRAATVFAGPAANFLLSVLLFAGIALVQGKASDEPVIAALTEDAVADIGFQPGDRVLEIAGEPVEGFSDLLIKLGRTDGAPTPALVARGEDRLAVTVRYQRQARVDGVVPGGAAAIAGVRPGDIVVGVDGTSVDSFHDVQLALADRAAAPDAPLRLELQREDRRIELTLTPELQERPHPLTGEVMPLPTIGIRGAGLGGIEPISLPVGPLEAAGAGVSEVGRIITTTLVYLRDIVFRGADSSQLGGPIRIAEVSGQAASEGAMSFVWLIAVLSTSIGLINLFPIPVLDGGHLMFYAIEALRGRPVGGAAMRVGTMIGLSLVLLLMVFATYNDLVRA